MSESDLVEILRKLKNQFEQDPECKFESLTADYVPSIITAIEGFEIRVDSLNAVFKLSQNRDDEDFASIVARFDERGGESTVLAAEMRAQRTRMKANVLPTRK